MLIIFIYVLFQRHEHYSHLETKRYKCDFENCFESFIKKEHLIKHKNERHNCQLNMKSCDWPGCEFATGLKFIK
jgi:hypothetical protein